MYQLHRFPVLARLPSSLVVLTLLAVVVLSASSSPAAIQLPTQMNQTDRREVLKVLGLGMSSKLLTDPYPLGGYSGFEFGIELENLPTDDLAHLGSHLSNGQDDVTYPKLTLGKGLYNNLDIFVQFAPYDGNDQISQYGALTRWGFYQAAYLPLSASLVLNVNSANIANQVTTWSYGADLVGGLNVSNVALYAGFGILRASGYFIGGLNGVTDSGNVEKESVSSLHTLAGATVHVQDYFLSLQIDRYTVPVVSAKVGMRF